MDYGIDQILATLAPFVSEARAQRIEEILAARLSSLSIVLENLYDPHNGAAAIRSVEAFGLTHIHVIETAQQFQSAPAVTIGCEKWIDVQRHTEVATCARVLRSRGARLYATLPGVSRTIADIDVSEPVAILFGNEHEGLTAEAIAACDDRVSLPMYGFTQSFNLSVSVALVLQELSGRRRKLLNRPGDLGDQERAQLRAEWYVQSVKAAAQILGRECVKLNTEDVAERTQSPRNP